MGLNVSNLSVRRCTQIAAPPDKVWEQVRSFDRLKAWFGIGHRLESYTPGADGKISMSVEFDDRVRPFGGNIVVWEPGRELSIEDNWYDEDMAWPTSTFITFRLSAVDSGTFVELFHHGFEKFGESAASEHEGYEKGWSNQHLVALRKIIEAS